MLAKIHHLIRYFVIFGLIVFVGFLKNLQPQFFLLLIGPVIFLAYTAKSFIDGTLTALPSSNAVHSFVFLLPLTVLYFGFIGFQLKQLWNERGKIKIAILIVFLGFIFYIHMLSFKSLSLYLAVPA